MASREIKKIAIVFSGGLARGAAQLAFAKPIIEKIGYDRIAVISGSSIGSFNSYAVSVKNIDKMLNFYSNLDCDSTKHFIKKIKRDLFNKIYNQIEGEEMFAPTYVSGTRLFGLDCQYFCLNSMSRLDRKAAINVSMSFPPMNGPLMFNHHLWVDGGATDNVPVLPTTYFDPDMVIIFHCYPKYYPPEGIYTKLKEDAVVIDIDVTLELPKTITSFTLSKIDFNTMIDICSVEGEKFAEKVFRDFDIKEVKERCFEYTRSNLEKRREKAGDGLMGFVDVLNALYTLKNDII